ncbi:MAG: 16S rRNA (uracil(1498)-N(3))-methyltransferase [Polyangiaceae bacterium]|nr:16S rRNA (uracil(1498)-N(3))-methyltransferase [Polyangiaceae bacterium]
MSGAVQRLLRVPVERLVPGPCVLSKETSAYVARVHRLREGDAVVAFDPEQAVQAHAVVLRIEDAGYRVTVEVSPPEPATVVASRRLTLIQAIGKGDKMDAIVRDATELGATHIVPVISERSVVKLGDVGGRPARWRRIAVEAARQSGRGDAPRVAPPALLAAAVSEVYTSPAPGLCVCLAPGAPPVLGDLFAALEPTDGVTIVVGPEGGLSEAEVNLCTQSGFTACGLGGFVLRTETVCAAVLGALLIGAPSPKGARQSPSDR